MGQYLVELDMASWTWIISNLNLHGGPDNAALPTAATSGQVNGTRLDVNNGYVVMRMVRIRAEREIDMNVLLTTVDGEPNPSIFKVR